MYKGHQNKCFVGQVVECIDLTGEYIIKLMKQEEQNSFSWPDNEDGLVIANSDIKIRFPQPLVDRRECLIFSVAFYTLMMGLIIW